MMLMSWLDRSKIEGRPRWLKTAEQSTKERWKQCRKWGVIDGTKTQENLEVMKMSYILIGIEGNGNPLQCSCLENPRDGGSWWAAVHGVAEVGHDWATSLSLFTFMHWRRKWQPTPVFLPGEFQGRGSLMGCCLWGCTESDTTEVT